MVEEAEKYKVRLATLQLLHGKLTYLFFQLRMRQQLLLSRRSQALARNLPVRYLNLSHAADNNQVLSLIRPAPQKMILTIDSCTAAMYATLFFSFLSLVIHYTL